METVILYGTGIEGEKFYQAYRKKYKILYCIDKMYNRPFHGLSIVDFENVAAELKKNYFIIVAAKFYAYKEISANLRGIGLKEWIDYKDADLIGNKKLAILYGNCHMKILKEYLENNLTFSEIYKIRLYIICEIEKDELDDACVGALRDFCRLLITQDIRKENSQKMPSADQIISKAGKWCRCIKIPNVFNVNLFFPQIKAVYGDENIIKLNRNKNDIQEIINSIENEDVYDAEMIQKNFRKQIEKLYMRERKCDIVISDYILENYQTKQLFYEPYHPTNDLICEKGRRIIKLLKLEIDESVPVRNAIDDREMFIYGCVRKALGITFEQKIVRKSHCFWTLKNNPMDLKEYIEYHLLDIEQE